MAVEDEADRAALLADFGEAVTVTPVAGSPRSCVAIYDAPGSVVDLGGELRAAADKASLYGRESDLGALAVGDGVAVAGHSRTFTVGEPPEPDGTGFARVGLAEGWP